MFLSMLSACFLKNGRFLDHRFSSLASVERRIQEAPYDIYYKYGTMGHANHDTAYLLRPKSIMVV